MKHVTLLVSNDLQHDQRVAKVSQSLVDMGFQVTLVGRLMRHSAAYTGPFQTRRFRLPFERGAAFYAALNIRLFFYLIFAKTDIIVANDLDTLLPAYVVSKWRRKKLVYDSHEYFTEAEGLTGRPFQKSVWTRIEKFIFPRLKHVITVNESIAEIYRQKYGVPVHVVRNIPLLKTNTTQSPTRAELNLPDDKLIVLLQGSYIDPDRGGLELVGALQYTKDALLLVIGAGRDYANMQKRATLLQLDNVLFLGRLPYQTLMQYTRVADIGVSLDKPLHLNYALSLPNKLFDYIHAGIAVLVSNLPELRRIVEQYDLGLIVEEVEEKAIAMAIENMRSIQKRNSWKAHAELAKSELNWQNESKVLLEIYTPFL